MSGPSSSQETPTGRSCWAERLGDCDGPLSKEHVISSAVFDETMLEVEGIHAFGDVRKTVSTAALTARVLCRGHNSQLSPLDSEAARLSDAIKASRIGSDPVMHQVNGILLERWALKVLVNLLASRWTEKGYLPPGLDIIEKVFGSEPILAPSGLYVLHNYTGTAPADSVFYSVLTSQRELRPHVLGLVISLSGALFVLSICRLNLEAILREHSPFGRFDTSNARTAYRPHRVKLGDRGKPTPSLTIEFDWNGIASAT